jgi:hypothetical protein
MGANQALESAAAFVNSLRPFLSRRSNYCPSISIPQSEVESCLKQYDLRRRARVTTAFQIANLTCRAQLMIGPAGKEYCSNLPKMMSAAGTEKLLESFCNAEVLEDWSIGSSRVALYTAFAEAKANQSIPRLWLCEEKGFQINS